MMQTQNSNYGFLETILFIVWQALLLNRLAVGRQLMYRTLLLHYYAIFSFNGQLSSGPFCQIQSMHRIRLTNHFSLANKDIGMHVCNRDVKSKT